MSDILHRVGVENATTDEVYTALTTLDGLSGWWAEKTTGDTEVGGVITFAFGPGELHMRVAELEPGKRVRWDVADGPEEWMGTSIQFDLHAEGDYAIVLFRHENWREPVEFMHHCSTKWATFLMSLKELVETGVGRPDPRDVRISDWH